MLVDIFLQAEAPCLLFISGEKTENTWRILQVFILLLLLLQDQLSCTDVDVNQKTYGSRM